MRHADGHWVWVHDISTAVLDEDGNLDYFLGFLTDVSSRRKAEERLREAELRFRTMVEQNPAVFYVQEIDPNDPTRAITTLRGTGRRGADRLPVEQVTAAIPSSGGQMVHADDREMRVRGRRIEQHRRLRPVRPRNTGSSARTDEWSGSSTRRGSSDPEERVAVLAGVPARHHGAEGGRASAPGRPRAPAADGRLRTGRRRQHGHGRPDHRRGTRRRRRRSGGAPRRSIGRLARGDDRPARASRGTQRRAPALARDRRGSGPELADRDPGASAGTAG